jgi:hypothetical protein
MKKINIFLWFIFNHKRYITYRYIVSLDFDSESSYKTTKNLSRETIDFFSIKNNDTINGI